MSKRAPTDEALRSMLHMGHFGADQGSLPPSDPLTRTTISRVPIEQIDFYDRNPRRVRNPSYDEIKESIRTSGVLQNPKITRRPGAARYMLAFGGNTRLAILRELLAETNDARFSMVDCDFVPWASEAAVLVGHLIENETRGELALIDKARGVREARSLLESEAGHALSKRELVDTLRERGFRINPPMLTRYDYALDVLLEAIPQALDAGLGRAQITRLRQLDTAAQTVWQRRALGTDEIYRGFFSEALATTDSSAHWDVGRVRKAVESTLAQRAEVDTRTITLELGAELDDAEPGDDDTLIDIAAHSGFAAPQLDVQAPATASIKERRTTGSTTKPIPDLATIAHEGVPRSQTSLPITPPILAQDDDTVEGPESKLDEPDLSDLRTALRESGVRYAKLAGLGQCIRDGDESEWIAYGYLVTDFPEGTRCSEARVSDAARQALAWSFWTLAQCCDLFGFIERMILERYATTAERELACAQYFGLRSTFVKAWSDGAAQQIVDDTVGNADAYGYSDYVEAASPELWAADMHLRQSYRNLRMRAGQTGVDLWDEAAVELPT